MKKQVKIILLFSAIFLSLFSFSNETYFIKNKGQIIGKNGQKIDEIICFYKGVNFDVFFGSNKISYVFKKISFEQNERSESMLKHPN